MDNSEDIIIPKKSSKTPAVSDNTVTLVKKETNKPLLLTLIIAGVFIIVLVVSVIILLNKKPAELSVDNNPGESSEEADEEEAESVYTTPDDVEDATVHYQNYLEEQKAAAKTEKEIFDAELRIIANKISDEEYEEAASRLEALSTEGLSTAELFRYYNVYTRLYEATGDTEKFDEYVDLRTEQLNILAAEEDEEE